MSFDVVKWMAENGHPGYESDIRALEAIKDETRAEAGRYWAEDPFVAEQLKRLDAAIEDIRREAYDRYDDWRTDPLP